VSVRKTRFSELGYEQHAPDLWRIIALDGNAAVGPHYKSQAELLGDLKRYAREYGCEAARPTLPYPLDAYRNAPNGIGPLAFDWRDNPAAVLIDLCEALEKAGFR